MIALSRRASTFQPYRAARHESAIGVLLDANESPAGGFTEETELGEVLASLGRYPDPANVRLREAAAAVFDVPLASIFAGNGSDEAINLLFAAFTDPGDEVLVTSPSYGMYAVQAALNAVDVTEVPLDAAFRLDLTAMLRGTGKRTRMVFLCSPNNPTGNLLGRRAILAAAEKFCGLVIVDEAYVEFAEVPSLAAEAAREGSSLVVLRTLSKAWGLAGLRVGFAIAEPAVVDVLQKVKLPYNLGALACALAVRALEDGDRVARAILENGTQRELLAAGMRTLGLDPYPSAANFLLVPHPAAPHLVQRLRREWSIVVRDRTGLSGLPAAFRVSVGSAAENALFLEALGRCLA